MCGECDNRVHAVVSCGLSKGEEGLGGWSRGA